MGGAALAVGCSARGHGGWDFLSDAQASTLAALCDRIVPADDFPSATQAGVVTYIDRQLARTYRRYRNTYRDGLNHRPRKCLGYKTPHQVFWEQLHSNQPVALRC
jgi:hypothetical protein